MASASIGQNKPAEKSCTGGLGSVDSDALELPLRGELVDSPMNLDCPGDAEIEVALLTTVPCAGMETRVLIPVSERGLSATNEVIDVVRP